MESAPRIRVVSSVAGLARAMGNHLTEAGMPTEWVHDPSRDGLTLFVAPGLDRDARTALLRRIAPFTPSVVERDDLVGVFAELSLGGPSWDGESHLRISVEGDELADWVPEALATLEVRAGSVERTFVPANTIVFGGAPRFYRQALRWMFARRGIELTEKRDWAPSDLDIVVHAADPAVVSLPPRERMPLQILSDCVASAEPVAQLLREAGFPAVVSAGPRDPRRFELDTGALERLSARDALDLRATIERVLASAGIDAAQWPLRVQAPRVRTAGSMPTLTLPIGACRRGALRPYGGGHLAHHEVTIRTDRPDAMEPVVAALGEIGFSDVAVEALRPGEGDKLPFRLLAGALRDRADVFASVVAAAHTSARALGVGVAPEVRRLDSDDQRLFVELPLVGWSDGSRVARLRTQLDRFRVVVHHTDGDAAALCAALRAAGFRRVDSNRQPSSEARVQFGGAPDASVQRAIEVCRGHAAFEPELENAWGPNDRDIFLWLPAGALHGTAAASPDRPADLPDLDRWVHGEPQVEQRSFVHASASDVHVGHVRLPRRLGRHPLAPALAEFRHYCLDAPTADTVLHVAKAVSVREPCLLEGETSTAKTSAVLYLAALLGQPVVRLNLHGQTDTGELIGRHVPSETDGSGPFVWQEGAVLRAMREGCWLLLDELNLAEPQILERLNSLLERAPSLVVSEHEGERIGPDQIHADFRLIATMNPAEYAGRSAMSPAWRNRWRAHRVVPAPGEREMEHFLRAAVFGDATPIEVAGTRWVNERTAPAWGSLATAPGMMVFLSALARFHVSLDRSLSSSDGPGSRRRERFVVTRRSLLSVLDWLAAHGGSARTMREALARYYLEPVAPADRAAVARLMDAAGIGPRTWAVPAGPAALARVPAVCLQESA